MKPKKIKLILSLLVALLVFMPLTPIIRGEDGGGKTKTSTGVLASGPVTVSNGSWTMTASNETGEVVLKNNENDYSWYSNPVDKEEDAVAAGFNKMNLSSQLIVSFITPKNVLEKTNNLVGSIRAKTFECYKTDKGVKFVFDFKREGFKIPLEFRLENGVFQCEVITSEIEEYGDNFLSEIQVLPFFGAGNMADDGYVMVPDGGGALINFGKTAEKAKTLNNYTGYVYGRDPILTTVFKATTTEAVTVPMFGIKNNEGAFLAVIEQGDMLSKITATPNNKETAYTNVSPTLIYRTVDNAVLREMNANEKSVLTFNKADPKLEGYKVSYHLLSGENADYSGMARVASTYYFGDTEKDKNAQNTPSLYLEMTAGAETSGYFLGIPVKEYLSLTTLKQANEMVTELKAEGVSNLRVKYDSWNRGGGYTKMPVKASVQGDITKGMKLSHFLESMTESTTPVFFTSDLVRVYQSGNGINKSAHSARAVSGGEYVDYLYKASTYRKDFNNISWTYHEAGRFNETAKKHINALNKKGIKTYGDLSSGWNLTSDSRRPFFGEISYVTRKDSLDNYLSAYEAIKEKTDYRLFDGGLGYTFKYATDITSLPNHSSRYEIFDEDIPFVQMILHGYVNYSAKPINLTGDYNLAVLKSVEYGSVPTFSLVYENEEQMSKTPYNDRYSVKYSDWKNKILETNNKLADYRSKTSSSEIIAHQAVSPAVYKVTYANGTVVFVNYSDENFMFEEKIVSSKSFVVFDR